MSYDDNQNEFPLPAGNEDKSNKRRSAYHLPKYFRTTKNNKFLAATLDQMIQPGVVEKLNGYVGRESAKAFSSDDTYLTDVTKQRTDYQLEPAAVIKDSLDNVTFYKDYNDFMNQLQNFNLSTNDHSKTNGFLTAGCPEVDDWLHNKLTSSGKAKMKKLAHTYLQGDLSQQLQECADLLREINPQSLDCSDLQDIVHSYSKSAFSLQLEALLDCIPYINNNHMRNFFHC